VLGSDEETPRGSAVPELALGLAATRCVGVAGEDERQGRDEKRDEHRDEPDPAVNVTKRNP